MCHTSKKCGTSRVAEKEVDIKGLTVVPFTSYPFIVSGISLIT
jgi:hypothetical protein